MALIPGQDIYNIGKSLYGMFGSKQALGNVVDSWGTQLGIPETGISERIAGAPTTNTATNRTYASTGTQPLMSYANQSYGTPVTPTGSVLGANTSGGDDRITQLRKMGNLNPIQQEELNNLLGNQGGQQNQQAEQERILNEGYNQYLSNLDQQLGFYGQSAESQRGQAQNAYNQGANMVGSQYAQNQADLSASREKTLRDLSQNLMQSWQQGNTYLGTRGASDSSAANQYAYALTKMGNQARGDVQGQYDQNMFKLKNTYDTELKNLDYQKQNQLAQISQWYAEAQAQVAGLKGRAAQERSQQALSMAMQMAQQVQADNASKMQALDSWAANHATSWNQLAGQLAQTSSFKAPTPTFNNQGWTGGTGRNTGVMAGYGATTEDKNSPYPIATMIDGRTKYSDGSIR